MEPRLPNVGIRVGLQVAVQPVEGFVAQEIGPPDGGGGALDDEVEGSRLAAPGGVPAADRAALRVEPERRGEYFQNRRLARAVLPDQHSRPGRQLETLAGELRDGG